MAVELALEFGVDQGNGRGAAGGGGGQTGHGAAGATQVFVRRIDHQVGVGGVVDGGDLPVPNANGFVHHFDHWSQAVGGARGGRDDAVFGGVVLGVVDAHHDVQHIAHLHGGGHDDTFGTPVQVALNGFRAEELACAFEHQVHTHIAPGNVGRVRV